MKTLEFPFEPPSIKLLQPEERLTVVHWRPLSNFINILDALKIILPPEAHQEEANHEEANHEEANHEEANHEEANHEEANHEEANHEEGNQAE